MALGGRKKGEATILHCTVCSWGTELSLEATEQSQVVKCAHCGKAIYWHRCDTCGLCYVGAATPHCAICDDATFEDVEIS